MSAGIEISIHSERGRGDRFRRKILPSGDGTDVHFEVL
jgi:hypothetical protein